MKQIKETGIFLLFFVSIVFIGTSLLFFLRISITKFHLPIFFGLTAFVYYVLRKKEKNNQIVKTIFLSFLIILFSILITSFMFDRSSDGNTYHKDAVGVLKQGWNPVYQDSSDFIKTRKDNSKKLTEYTIWLDHYAKANWIVEANFYSLTNNIESGKAFNVISIYIVFSFLFTKLVSIMNKKKAFIFSLIVVINPITAAQIFTFYNDQLVCLYLFLAVFFLIQLDHDIHDKKIWFYYTLTFIVLANMKFNGLGYLLVFSFLFVCRYLYQSYKKQQLKFLFQKLCYIFIPLFIISLVIVGYPTYVKNTLNHSNPFFPLYDENGEDIITHQQPKSFKNMNSLEKLFYATFSKANNLRDNDKTTLKIPFTVYQEEFVPAASNDLRISGFGLFFSGLLIISIVIFIRGHKECQKESWIFYILAITILLLLVMSESWWARYTPHFYFFILLSLYLLLKKTNKNKFTIFYISIIVINSLFPFITNTYYTGKRSIQFLSDIHKLHNQEIKVNLRGNNGCLYNLKDFHVSYELDNSIKGDYLYYNYLRYQEK